MNSYTYKDVSWRVFGEINDYTVAVKFLNAREAHRSALTNFLWHAMGVMQYTAKKEEITYTIAETESGYDFNMEWRTSQVKAETILEYTELLKSTGQPEPGKTDWRNAVARHLKELLAYSSQFEVMQQPQDDTDLAVVRMQAQVRFTSLVPAPNIPSFYMDGPQRLMSIFDLFDFEFTVRRGPHMEFFVDEDQCLYLRTTARTAQNVLPFGDREVAHGNLVRFLQAVRNIMHSVDEKIPLVNVASLRTSSYYGEDMEHYLQEDEYDEDPWYAQTRVLHTRYAFYGDNDTVYSLDLGPMLRYGESYNLLFREGANLELEDDWFYRNKCLLFTTPTRAELEAPVRMTIALDSHDLRNAVQSAFTGLADHFGPDRYREIFGAEFPQELVEKI